MSKLSTSPHRISDDAQRQQDEPLLGLSDDPDAYNFVHGASESTPVVSALSGDASVPWYRRPSPAWVLVGTFLAAIALSSTIAPRVELFVKLACQEIHPDYEPMRVYHPAGGVMDWPSSIGTVTIPRPSAKCQSDPAVQQAAARLGATLTTIMGSISCVTAGWWGKFSDRYGRVRLLALTLVGGVCSDLILVFVALASDRLPGGYRFLTVAPVIDGLMGGIATGSAATHAYLSDTTSSANRSRVFSLLLGLLFTGMACGPLIGAQLISWSGDLLSVFYLAALVHFTYLLLTIFILPESLTKERAAANTEQARKQAEDKKLRRQQEVWQDMSVVQRILRVLGHVFFFLEPLSIFVPRKRGPGGRRNWNLLIIAITYGCVALIVGSYQFKFQYANYVYGWTSQQLGTWLSIVGTLRAINLIVILPAFIKYFGPKPQSSQTPGDGNSLPGGLPHSARFDLLVIRLCLCLELVQYSIAIASQTALVWASATIVSSFTGGIGPSLQALAVETFSASEKSHVVRDNDTQSGGDTQASGEEDGPRRESDERKRSGQNYGQLFGAMAVVQALCSQMLGPAFFGAVFVASIKTFPKGIFVAGMCIIGLALVFISFVRIPRPSPIDSEREPLLSPSHEGE
ncbi:SubName: Full=Uncharacterized protein {ECO:0000313/EMBL:CCA73304.1} [Serendipita indica DSM 11827]|nr:SubName: Full=Uncharacterized protein {ECO:0000313/EMBL:CCA73304.1} [Serendipita indica DSM 11827]